MEKRREIDFANVFLCLLVMLIHILSESRIGSGQDKSAICGGLYTVQAFVLCCPGLYFFERGKIFYAVQRRRI